MALFPVDSAGDLHETFPDEAWCVAYLKSTRWPIRPCCPLCGHDKIYPLVRKARYLCATCHRGFSVNVGTIFQGSRLPKRTWLMAIWILSNASKGVTSVQLARDLQVSQNAACAMLRRLRHGARTAAFRRPLRTGDKGIFEGPPVSAGPGIGSYEPKLKIEIPFAEAVARYARVSRQELHESLKNSTKRPSRRPHVRSQSALAQTQ